MENSSTFNNSNNLNQNSKNNPSHINIYTNYLLQNFNNKTNPQKTHIKEKFVKPNKNLHFSSSKLYYYFDSLDSDPSFDQIKNTLEANFNLYKQDIIDDLDSTENLYEMNDDGSFTISKNKKLLKIKFIFLN